MSKRPCQPKDVDILLPDNDKFRLLRCRNCGATNQIDYPDTWDEMKGDWEEACYDGLLGCTFLDWINATVPHNMEAVPINA